MQKNYYLILNPQIPNTQNAGKPFVTILVFQVSIGITDCLPLGYQSAHVSHKKVLLDNTKQNSSFNFKPHH